MCHEFLFSLKTLSFPSPAVYQDVCDPQIPGVLKSVFSTPQPSLPILPVHATIAAPHVSPSFFQTEIVQAFAKTFASLTYQDFINLIRILWIILLPLILCILCYPFAQTWVSPPASTLAALQTASFTCIPFHFNYLLFQKQLLSIQEDIKKPPKDKRFYSGNSWLESTIHKNFWEALKLQLRFQPSL